MRSFIVAIAICLAQLAYGQTLRVGVLNAEWFWTPFDNRVDGSRFNQGDPSIPNYLKELRFYKQLIRTNKIDILALIEVENEQVLRELAETLGPDWQIAFMQGRDTATGQDVGFIYRTGNTQRITDFGFPSGHIRGHKPKRLSKVLGVELELDQASWMFITSHFLSKRNETPKKAANRLMQAKAIVKAGDELGERGPLVVLGDFNDTVASPVLKVLTRELNLENAQGACKEIQSAQAVRHLVDHILFRGVRCNSLEVIDTADYSDHPLLIAELAL